MIVDVKGRRFSPPEPVTSKLLGGAIGPWSQHIRAAFLKPSLISEKLEGERIKRDLYDACGVEYVPAKGDTITWRRR